MHHLRKEAEWDLPSVYQLMFQYKVSGQVHGPVTTCVRVSYAHLKLERNGNVTDSVGDSLLQGAFASPTGGCFCIWPWPGTQLMLSSGAGKVLQGQRETAMSQMEVVS
jgi:hypothetical protein